MREKLGNVYPESIGHAENDDGFDLFRPYGIVENPPFEIPSVQIDERVQLPFQVFDNHGEIVLSNSGRTSPAFPTQHSVNADTFAGSSGPT